MRWLLRLLLFWAISGPLFYLFGLPKLMDYMNHKTRTATRDQCIAQLRDEGKLGSNPGQIPPTHAEQYCHCVSDKLTITRADLIDMVQQKPPTALTALSQNLGQQCGDDLTRVLNAEAAKAFEAMEAQQQPASGNAAPAPAHAFTIIENPN